MKNLLIVLAMIVGSFGVANAQTTQTANEGYVGYSFVRQHVKADVNNTTFRFHEDTDSHGVVAAYTRYFGGDTKRVGVVGFTGEVGANFNGDGATLVTAMGGLTAKARNSKYVQPFVKGLIGGAKENVTRTNLFDRSDVSLAYELGAGFDVNLAARSRYKLRFGADYINTGFRNERQNAVRLTTGIVF